MFRLIVAGSRNFDNFELLSEKLNFYLQNKDTEEIVIISGGAKGADRLGEEYARKKGYIHTVIKPDWKKYGKAAGHLRNEQMLKLADACIVFWDGVSPGTKHMVKISKKKGIPTKVVKF